MISSLDMVGNETFLLRANNASVRYFRSYLVYVHRLALVDTGQ